MSPVAPSVRAGLNTKLLKTCKGSCPKDVAHPDGSMPRNVWTVRACSSLLEGFNFLFFFYYIRFGFGAFH